MIEPGVRSLVAATAHRPGRGDRHGRHGRLGRVPAGRGRHDGARVELTCAACPGFVEFVEQGEFASDQVHVLAERLLAPVREAEVDTLLLGCTHYPFLARTIGDVMGRDVVLVSSADETGFEVRRSCSTRAWPGRGRDGPPAAHRWLSSGDVNWFSELGAQAARPGAGGGPAGAWPAWSLAVTVLGSSGTLAGPDEACSGYLLRSATTTVVVDLGAGRWRTYSATSRSPTSTPSC